MRTYTIVHATVIFMAVVYESDGLDCCMNYTDFYGNYHSSQLCQHYCCWSVSLTDRKVCCDEVWRWIIITGPEETKQCFEIWVEEHAWVINIVFAIIIAILSQVLLWCCRLCLRLCLH
ncbi:uncharacterized protein LOC127879799 [Dreissena polymorpha]|uniref:uncharacterized protein LOC127879799 n=1 Tax=Dreissena polymorpha TaxID=45954 RepID=UPI0022640E0B|nr:uncharacterized protein LOC127879799 [Dreissena polymorpha]